MKRTTIAFRMGYVLRQRTGPERYEDLRLLAAHFLNSTVMQKLLLKLKDFLWTLVTTFTGRNPLWSPPAAGDADRRMHAASRATRGGLQGGQH